MNAPPDVTAVFDKCGVHINWKPEARTNLERILAETWQGEVEAWSFGACKVCRRTFEAGRRMACDVELVESVCEACGPLVTEHYGTANAAEQSDCPWWDENCPPAFRRFIIENEWPDHVDRSAVKSVSAWGVSMKTGLLLIGPSGAGKTFALWGKARQLEKTGSKPVFLDAIDLARALATSARDIEKPEWLFRCGCLFIDDLGKEKLTAAVAPLLWQLIDYRYAHAKPTLVSTRFRDRAFTDRFTDAILAEDIRGRIADSSEVITFSRQA
jgi:hypothetical protein